VGPIECDAGGLKMDLEMLHGGTGRVALGFLAGVRKKKARVCADAVPGACHHAPQTAQTFRHLCMYVLGFKRRIDGFAKLCL
jgi:hypothetical protein